MIWIKLLNILFLGLIFSASVFHGVDAAMKKNTSKGSKASAPKPSSNSNYGGSSYKHDNTHRASRTTTSKPRTYQRQEPSYTQNVNRQSQAGNQGSYPSGNNNQGSYPRQQNPQGSYGQQPAHNPNYVQPGGYPNQQGGFGQGGYHNQPGGFGQGGYHNQPGGFGQGGYHNQPGGFGHGGGYPNQPGGFGQGGYHGQGGYGHGGGFGHGGGQQGYNPGYGYGHNSGGFGNMGYHKKKSHTGRNIATHVAAGLGGAYLGYQLSKHANWYDRRKAEREEYHRTHTQSSTGSSSDSGVGGSNSYSNGGGNSYQSGGNSYQRPPIVDGISEMTPVEPFKVNDIKDDKEAIDKSVLTYAQIVEKSAFYGGNEDHNDVEKAGASNMFLLNKLRPADSDMVPVIKRNVTQNELAQAQNKLPRDSNSLLGALNPVTPDGGHVSTSSANPTPSSLPLYDPRILPLTQDEISPDDEKDQFYEKSKKEANTGTTIIIANSLILATVVVKILAHF